MFDRWGYLRNKKQQSKMERKTPTTTKWLCLGGVARLLWSTMMGEPMCTCITSHWLVWCFSTAGTVQQAAAAVRQGGVWLEGTVFMKGCCVFSAGCFGTVPGEVDKGAGGKGRVGGSRGEAKATLAAFQDGDGAGRG